MKTLLITMTGESLRFVPLDSDEFSRSPMLREFDVDVPLREIDSHVNAVNRTLAGGEHADFSASILDAGGTLYHNLVPEGLRDELSEHRGPLLICSFNANIPWELCHDGDEFWGFKYEIGRQAASTQAVLGQETQARSDSRPCALVVGSDPRGDLPQAHREANDVYRRLQNAGAKLTMKTKTATFSDVVQSMKRTDWDILHFSGHMESSSGSPELLLEDGPGLSPYAIQKNLRGHPLVYLNCCRSAGTPSLDDPRQSLGITNAFLLARATGVVASIADVVDEHAHEFSDHFYRHLVDEGATYGAALRMARVDLRRERPDSPAWASFVLYGLPTVRLRQEPTWGRAEKVKVLFDDAGELAADSWTVEAREILSTARGRALSASLVRIEPRHLVLGLVQSPWFKTLLTANVDPAEGEGTAARTVSHIRQWSGCRGVGLPTEGSVTRNHLTDMSLEICEEAARRADNGPIRPRDLLAEILEDPAVADLFSELDLDVKGFLASECEAPFVDVAKRTTSSDSDAEARAIRTPEREEAIERPELFDVVGQLNARAVDDVVYAALSTAAAAGNEHEPLTPARLLVCLATSKEVLKSMGVSAKDYPVLRPLLQYSLESMLGIRHRRRRLKRSPVRQEMAEETLMILQELFETCDGVIDAESLMSRLRDLQLVSADAELGEMDERTAALLRRIVAVGRRRKARREGVSDGNTSPEQPASAPADLPPRGPAPSAFARDLSVDAAAGRLPNLVGRENELRTIGRTLARPDKANVLLVGEAGVGKSILAEGLATYLLSDDAPQALRSRRIVELDTGRLLAGARYQGDLEERVQNLLQSVRDRGDLILFVDEFQAFVAAGGRGGGDTVTVLDLLKPALARGEVTIIGAMTTQDYSLAVERDPALLRRFRLVRVGEPSPAETIEILRRVGGAVASAQGLRLDDEALETCVSLADRYLGGHRPDKAIDLLMDAIGQVRCTTGGRGPDTVDAELITTMVTERAGITLPEGLIDAERRADDLKERLERHVVGQDDVLGRVARRLEVSSQVRLPGTVKAAMLFVGPSGVGKTRLAQAVAREYFGSSSALTTIAMNEISDRVQLSRLTGVGPGWVGHDEDPLLVSALRRRPPGVVLFDEIDKAISEAHPILLRLLDEGRITDPRTGLEVDGSECVFIMTSNAWDGGAGIGFARETGGGGDVRTTASLPTEFLNRIDDVLRFAELDRDALGTLAERRLTELLAVVCRDLGADVGYRPDVPAWIAAKAGVHEGGRGLERLVDAEVTALLGGSDPASDEFIAGVAIAVEGERLVLEPAVSKKSGHKHVVDDID